MHVVDMTGRRYGTLVVIERRGSSSKYPRAQWLCRCRCGREIIVMGYSLRSGNTSNCGCLRGAKSRTHGMTGTPEYRSWYSIKDRCGNSNNADYHNYGGRGVTVCERWLHSFQNFIDDMGARPAGTSLDRIDVNGHYEPSNCRWATPKEQSRNQRKSLRFTRGGETLCLAEWCERLSMDRSLVYRRLRRGESFERAISRKSRYRHGN